MNAYRIGLTLFMNGPRDLDLAQVVPVFHKWIQGQRLSNHLLIDVADYQHVQDGPGIVLISHEANIGLQRCRHRPGEYALDYLRKRPFGTTFSDRVYATATSALAAAALFQEDLPDLRLKTDRLRLRILDKLNAPNDGDTLRQALPAVESVFSGLLGGPVRVQHRPHDLKHFEVSIEPMTALSAGDVLQRASVKSH